MNIQQYINDYANWIKTEITYTQIGEYIEINTPFLNTDNDYLQFYIKQEGEELFFTDDGFFLNDLEASGLNLKGKRREQLNFILNQYGVHLIGKEIVMKAPANCFPERKHLYTQCLIRVSDLYMLNRPSIKTFFTEDIMEFFEQNEIYCVEGASYTGKSGLSHKYDFTLQRSKDKPERFCLAINKPSTEIAGNAIFAWEDTKSARKTNSKLIVFLNDRNKTDKQIDEALSNYDISSIRWSERNKHLHLLSA